MIEALHREAETLSAANVVPSLLWRSPGPAHWCLLRGSFDVQPRPRDRAGDRRPGLAGLGAIGSWAVPAIGVAVAAELFWVAVPRLAKPK